MTNKVRAIIFAVFAVAIVSTMLVTDKCSTNLNVNIKQDTIVEIRLPVIVEVKGTYYNPVPAQCDDSPLITADNSKIDLEKLKARQIRWVALSRDLLKRWGGPFDYGDTLYVHHPNVMVMGKWVVHDSMNKRFRKRIDFLVALGNQFPSLSDNVLICDTLFYQRRE